MNARPPMPRYLSNRYAFPEDVRRVGMKKALGYVMLDDRGSRPLSPILKELRARGISTLWMWPGRRRRYRAQTLALCSRLPPFLYNRKLRQSWDATKPRHALLYAYDHQVLSELLLSNRQILLGYPATPQAFVELVYFVMICGGELQALIDLAFLWRRG